MIGLLLYLTIFTIHFVFADFYNSYNRKEMLFMTTEEKLNALTDNAPR